MTLHPKADAAQSGGTVSVTGPDGGPARARVLEAGDDLYVIPDVAVPYLAGGTLDRRLFDVTDLVSAGYDDAHRDSIPLIVSYARPPAGARPGPAPTPPKGSALVRRLPSVTGAAVTADHATAATFWQSVTGGTASRSATVGATSPTFASGIDHIWLDGKVHADLAESTAQIGAPQVWAGGNIGVGVDVAVLDTGIDTAHPDLAGRIAATRSFIPGEDVEDHSSHGHGTHVASTIAGTGAASGGLEKGVAPGARLHIGKVLSNAGEGTDSQVLAGMEWATVEEHAKVVNMSLGNDSPSDGTDPLSEGIDRLSADTGALFVVAAGNVGGPDTIGAPAAADAALTVGAVDSGDTPAWFSSQGPRVGDGGLKPEISAPGVDVLAARSQYATSGEGSYQTLSGTSMATPHVAGVAALVAAVHPQLTGAQVKDLLTSTSKPTPDYSAFQAGSGRVDALAAARATVFATGTASAGVNAGGAVRRPITYTNLGDQPVTLALEISAPQAPAGTFALSEPSVTVPAHGTASVSVTIDPEAVRGTGADGVTGQVRATGPEGVLAHTAVSLGAITHRMTISVKDAAGKPAVAGVVLLRESSSDPQLILVSGSETFYTPDDTYSVLGFLTVPGAHGPRSQGLALLGDPEVTFDHDTTIALDATRIRRVDETTPQASEPTYLRLEYARTLGNAWFHDFALTDTAYDSLWVQPQGTLSHGDFYLGARWRKQQPALTLSAQGSTYTDVLRQRNVTPIADGTHTFPLAYAGDGTTGDYAGADVRGKAVVVRRTTAVGPREQAEAAAKAGAAMLLVANDRNGRQQLSFGASSSEPTPIDVGLLSPDEGDRLIAQAKQGGVVVRAESHSRPGYLYDLMHTWHDQLPATMVLAASKKNLTRVDQDFASPSPSNRAEEWRFDFPEYTRWGIGRDAPLVVDSRRTDWVSTDGANTWGQEVSDGTHYEWAATRTYDPGASLTEEWFKPVQRPYFNNSYLGPTRTNDQMRIDVPGYGSADHVGSSLVGDPQTVTVYQGATELATSDNGLVLYPDAPSAESLPYRLVVTNRRDSSYSPYSSSTRTEWDFTSGAPKVADERVLLPLLQVGLDVHPDDAGKVSRRETFGVTIAHREPVAVGLTDVAVAGAGRPSAPRVEVSYDDGATWTMLRSDSQGRYRLGAPASAPFVSLRVSAKDSAGNSVDQTVLRAVGLR